MLFSTILLFQIIFYLMRIIICDDNQTVSNIINLNNEPSNFYKWMEQNSHICAIQEQDEDTPFFLKEIDSIKFDCATICGNPLDIPHMACGKRQSQLENEWPKCFSGIFRIEHLIAAVNQKNNLKIKKINLIEKIFPVGQLLVDSETTNKIQKTIKIEEEKN
ncbi:hypothetical protein Mgra_00001492 [Meloidogyne graminicola]|uniref:Uncharacterized protein n=1 Tax=Meloidogyne graminicola TaxID=189291 RepID=A0A8T0A0Z9_9BILA|nr:hypothetical protein Mgra_00001492 [Meloidogyne graminicola]